MAEEEPHRMMLALAIQRLKLLRTRVITETPTLYEQALRQLATLAQQVDSIAVDPNERKLLQLAIHQAFTQLHPISTRREGIAVYGESGVGKSFLLNHLLWFTEESREVYAGTKLWTFSTNDFEALDLLYQQEVQAVNVEVSQQEFIHTVVNDGISVLWPSIEMQKYAVRVVQEKELGTAEQVTVKQRNDDICKRLGKRPPCKLYPFLLPEYSSGTQATTPCRIRIRHGRTYQLLVRYLQREQLVSLLQNAHAHDGGDDDELKYRFEVYSKAVLGMSPEDPGHQFSSYQQPWWKNTDGTDVNFQQVDFQDDVETVLELGYRVLLPARGCTRDEDRMFMKLKLDEVLGRVDDKENKEAWAAFLQSCAVKEVYVFVPCGAVDGNVEFWDIPGQDCGHAEEERRQAVQEASRLIYLSDRDMGSSMSASFLRHEVVEPLLEANGSAQKGLAVLITSEKNENPPENLWRQYDPKEGRRTPWDRTTRSYREWIARIAKCTEGQSQVEELLNSPVLSPFMMNYLARQLVPLDDEQDKKYLGVMHGQELLGMLEHWRCLSLRDSLRDLIKYLTDVQQCVPHTIPQKKATPNAALAKVATDFKAKLKAEKTALDNLSQSLAYRQMMKKLSDVCRKEVQVLQSRMAERLEQCFSKSQGLRLRNDNEKRNAIRRAVKGGPGLNLKPVFFSESFLHSVKKIVHDSMDAMLEERGQSLRSAVTSVLPVSAESRKWLTTHLNVDLLNVQYAERNRLMEWVCQTSTASFASEAAVAVDKASSLYKHMSIEQAKTLPDLIKLYQESLGSLFTKFWEHINRECMRQVKRFLSGPNSNFAKVLQQEVCQLYEQCARMRSRQGSSPMAERASILEGVIKELQQISNTCVSQCAALSIEHPSTCGEAALLPQQQLLCQFRELGQQTAEKYSKLRVAELHTEYPLRIVRPLYFGGDSYPSRASTIDEIQEWFQHIAQHQNPSSFQCKQMIPISKMVDQPEMRSVQHALLEVMGLNPCEELCNELHAQLALEAKGIPLLEPLQHAWQALVAWVLKFQQKLHIYKDSCEFPLALHYTHLRRLRNTSGSTPRTSAQAYALGCQWSMKEKCVVFAALEDQKWQKKRLERLPDGLGQTHNLDTVAKLIKEMAGDGKRKPRKGIVVLVGAGISTSLGISGFRGSKGIFEKIRAQQNPKVSDPSEVFQASCFRKSRPHREVFYQWAHETLQLVNKGRPSEAHWFLKLLHQKGVLRRLYTQNIDMVEKQMGFNDTAMVMAHGNFDKAKCLKCNSKHSSPIKVILENEQPMPTCARNGCGGVLKPAVVFYGEGLPKQYGQCIKEDFRQDDPPELLIIMGTTLNVEPVSSIAEVLTPQTVPRVLFNNEMVKPFQLLNAESAAACSLTLLQDIESHPIIGAQGDLNEGISNLVQKIGWNTEFDNLMRMPVPTLQESYPDPPILLALKRGSLSPDAPTRALPPSKKPATAIPPTAATPSASSSSSSSSSTNANKATSSNKATTANNNNNSSRPYNRRKVVREPKGLSTTGILAKKTMPGEEKPFRLGRIEAVTRFDRYCVQWFEDWEERGTTVYDIAGDFSREDPGDVVEIPHGWWKAVDTRGDRISLNPGKVREVQSLLT